jgi:hypothetical protein
LQRHGNHSSGRCNDFWGRFDDSSRRVEGCKPAATIPAGAWAILAAILTAHFGEKAIV